MKYQEKYLKNENGWQKRGNNEINNFSCVFFSQNKKKKQYNITKRKDFLFRRLRYTIKNVLRLFMLFYAL